MGFQTRRRAITSWHRHDARSTFFFELRTNLVRFNAARRCIDKGQIVRTFTRTNAGMGTTVKFG